MTTVHCFTSATFSYLDRVRVLGHSLRKFHPDWTFWLCLSDREPSGFSFDLSIEPIDRLIRLEDLDIPNRECWTFKHDIVEICTAVKGSVLCHLLEQGAGKVVYLDPDVVLFNPLEEATAALDSHSIVLTPHLLGPESSHEDIVVNEISALKHGIYNLGFVAVSNGTEGLSFARWWRDRLLDFCFDDVPNGLFTDQRWCDHVPVFFPSTHILRNPGYNAASWNQSHRPIAFERDGSVTAGGAPLVFYHFTKITKAGERMLERYDNRSLAVFELVKWYRKQLADHAPAGLPAGWWAYSCYDDGTPIQHEHRTEYRHDPSLQARFPHPFANGTASLKSFFQTREPQQELQE